ncbi:DUF2336 domain-containing protein [Chelatococcus asaccharovorans]|uniref:DUF2336 domain-containing protein n=1 Tax=Chelatococcus asaccharovorans TaxID=28210 RepID=UPI00224C6BB2|nr:DUF2336 domain-containing protein [Chelatococcus asaccharovorans]CAH1666295.1 conserved exported hypothetical protein [Chelatococcus asaccharovorans]CAH1681550.1 conserved exported hypothetical protein [Chelatococcus asaccharovorans]
MIIRRYLVWATTATASQRAAAADVLVRAYHQSPLTDADRVDIDRALIGLASDESPRVRHALAVAFAKAGAVPAQVLDALLAREDEAAVALIARGAGVNAAQLVDCVALGDDATRAAIAAREGVSAPVAAALAEIASVDVLLVLLANRTALISPSAFLRMLDRHGHSVALQSAMLNRRDLPPFMRQALVSFLCQRLADFTVDRGWLTPARAGVLQVEAADMATMALVAEASEDALGRLVEHLIASGELTVGLLLRSLLCADPRLLTVSLAALTGLPRRDVEVTLKTADRAAFAAVYRQAGLPDGLLAAFRAALDAVDALPPEAAGRRDGRLSLAMVRRVITACEEMSPAEAGPLLALLERFVEEAEAFQDDRLSRPAPASPPDTTPVPAVARQALAA